MKKRLLRDIEVSEVGMGCMAFSHGYGQIPPETYSIEAMKRLRKPALSCWESTRNSSPAPTF